jgi:alkylhydroperoxidase family enzyme
VNARLPARPLQLDDERKLPERVQDLIRAARTLPASLDSDTRALLYARAAALSLRQPPPEIPEALKPFADKVALWAYRTLDREVEALREAGYTDDQIFELTICAALGAGAARYLTGLSALEDALG